MERRTSGVEWTLEWIPDLERLEQHWDDSVIYFILCNPTRVGYIGSAKCLSQRMKYHFSHLGTHQHPNWKMQAAYDQYGHDSFTWGIVEQCPVSDLESRERYWVKRYAPERLFNLDLKVSRNTQKVKIEREQAVEYLAKYASLEIGSLDNYGGWLEWFLVYTEAIRDRFDYWFPFYSGERYQALAGRVWVNGRPRKEQL